MQRITGPNLTQVSIGFFVLFLFNASLVVTSFTASSSLSPTTSMYTTSRLNHYYSYSRQIKSVLSSNLRRAWSHENPTIDNSRTRLYSTSRKERKEVAKRLGKNSKVLDWEHYEFSQK